MVTIIRDRVQDLIKQGKTLEQVKAAKPSRDYDTQYSSTGEASSPPMPLSNRYILEPQEMRPAIFPPLPPPCYWLRVADLQGPPPTPKAAAPVDFTGYWVSVVTEDWRWRMVTPIKGDFAGIPFNAEGRKLGDAWNPAADEAAGAQCKAYGAAAIMRVPGRLHITWADDNTLRIDTDAGMQTRLLHFDGKPAGEPSWQGYTVANWERPLRGSGFQQAGLGATREGTQGRSLEAVTTLLRSGYLRKNGAPYSANTVLKEYFDLGKERNGDTYRSP